MLRFIALNKLMPTLPVTFADVLAARRRIAPYLQPTPLYQYPSLDAMLGLELWVKHENHQPIGAFKVRGGINLVSQLPAAQRQAGVITASTGNHANRWRLRPGFLACKPALLCRKARIRPK